MLTIQTQKAYNKNNNSCFQKNMGELLPHGRPPGRALWLRLRAIPDGPSRGHNFPYFLKAWSIIMTLCHQITIYKQ